MGKMSLTIKRCFRCEVLASQIKGTVDGNGDGMQLLLWFRLPLLSLSASMRISSPFCNLVEDPQVCH